MQSADNAAETGYRVELTLCIDVHDPAALANAARHAYLRNGGTREDWDAGDFDAAYMLVELLPDFPGTDRPDYSANYPDES